MKRLAVALVAVTLIGACSDDGRPNATQSSSPAPASTTTATTPACARPHTAGQTSEAFDFDGQSRTYELYVPPTYDGTADVPVVFDIHGFGSNAQQQMIYGNFEPLADRDDFLIVAPDGQGDGATKHFNLSGEASLQDDIAMINALLDHIEETLCVDTKRVFATGMSDGGATSSVLACRSADRFAAFGPVAVLLFFPGCGGSHSVAIVGFMGTDDPVVPFDGGKVNCCGNATVPAAPDSMAMWAQHDGCATEFTDTPIGTDVRKRTWSGCTDGEVVFYIIDGGGHTWPGSIPIDRLGKTTTSIDASSVIWDFFKAHPLN